MDLRAFVAELSASNERCLHLVSLDAGELDALVGLIRCSALQMALIDGVSVSQEGELFDVIARSFKFPDYFGRNWDALDECLRDFSWLPAAGYVIILTGADDLWQRMPRAVVLLLSVVANGSTYWAEEGVPFHIVVNGHRVRQDLGEITRRVCAH